MDDLLFEGAEEALRDAVGLGLLDEGVARLDAPEAHLVAEVLGDVLRAVVHAQGEAPAGVSGHAAEVPGEALQPVAQGLARHFGGVTADAGRGLSLRLD